MTGFAVETRESASGSVTLELRGVNSRFLDLSFRMSDEFRPLEPLLRERISERVRRGKLECRVAWGTRSTATLPANPNSDLLARLTALAAQVRRATPDAAPLTTAEILRWPGMLGDDSADLETLQADVMAMLDGVLHQFNESRAREGQKLAAMILERVGLLRSKAEGLRPMIPDIVSAFRDKLTQRISEYLPDMDPDRVLQEVTLFAQKVDVDEELDRLLTHLSEIERGLKAGSPVGKRLDFLMQELNREANTLGSKSAALAMSQASVDFKVLIEQMREQVQNLE